MHADAASLRHIKMVNVMRMKMVNAQYMNIGQPSVEPIPSTLICSQVSAYRPRALGLVVGIHPPANCDSIASAPEKYTNSG